MRKREELKILVSRLVVCLIVIVLTVVLSGCHMVLKLPGGESFGEQTFTEGQAKAAYEAFSLSFWQEWQKNWRGYTRTVTYWKQWSPPEMSMTAWRLTMFTTN